MEARRQAFPRAVRLAIFLAIVAAVLVGMILATVLLSMRGCACSLPPTPSPSTVALSTAPAADQRAP